MAKSIKGIIFILLIIQFSVSSAQDVILKSIELNSSGQITELRFELNSSNDVLALVLNGNGFFSGIEILGQKNPIEYMYYDEYEEVELRSKLSKMGDTDINYYSSFEVPEKAGRISKIGSIYIDYYTVDPDKASKVYSIENIKMNYFTRSNDASLAGKIRSIGELEIDYFANTVETDKIGKLMLIGQFNFDYYTEYDSPVMRGKLKEVIGSDDNFELKVVNLF